VRSLLFAVAPLALIFAAIGCAAPAGDEATADDAPFALTQEGALDADAARPYAALAVEAGAALAKGTITVLGLRGLRVDGQQHGTAFARAFDDTLVVLRPDGTAQRFAASTHPFEIRGVPGVPDVDGDGASDVGMIRPGVYDVIPRDRLIAGAASFAVTQHGQGKLPGWRDTNHDGLLSDDERAASVRRADGLTDVLFHQGEGGAPPAVGCQVLPASAIRAFTAAVGGARARFVYVLVDVSDRDPSALPR
jgi:hypothetical protein